MGMSRITVEVVGNHGCQREVKDGDATEGCGSSWCIDCMSRSYVRTLKANGANVEKATQEHWPTSDPPGPVDDLLTGVREGSF